MESSLLTHSGPETYLLLANSQTDQTDALYRLPPQQPQLFLHGVLHDVLERGHEEIIVRHKLLLGRVSHRGDGRHHLLQDQLGSFLDQLAMQREKTLRLQTI